ncbi:LOW QUALITY PROTEIN: cysteine synthase 2-like, partial [Quercus suber]|uniref:LOW QUALITY PROTEIN: cysteine synthase 2-like n=1 Tax=Quercus suber TaxID=58331 RepID=UPI0032DE5E13
FSLQICLSQILEPLGAIVERVRPVSITDTDHFANIAQRRALEENEAASKHREADSMNPLAYDRMCSTGKNPNIKCLLIDPPGSSLIKKVTRGVMDTIDNAEGRRLKNPFETITEGLGKYRLAQNFMMAKLDGTFRGTDLKGVEMSWLEHAFGFLK